MQSNRILIQSKKPTTKNIFHKKSWRNGEVQILVDLPPITLIKSKNDLKVENECIKIKLCRDPTPENSDTDELKMALFDNGETEEFLLFTKKINMTLDALGTLASNAKLQHICTILHGEAIHQFYTLCDLVGSTTMKHLN